METSFLIHWSAKKSPKEFMENGKEDCHIVGFYQAQCQGKVVD